MHACMTCGHGTGHEHEVPREPPCPSCGHPRGHCTCLVNAISLVFFFLGVVFTIAAIAATAYGSTVWNMDADGLFHGAIVSYLLTVVCRNLRRRDRMGMGCGCHGGSGC